MIRLRYAPLLIALGLVVSGCPKATFTKQIVYKQVNGRADRGAAGHKEYNTDASRAVDVETIAGSGRVEWNSALGYVHAVPPDADEANVVQDDRAIATSLNKVQSVLRVRKAGNFIFDVDLQLTNPEIIKDGKLEINVGSVVNNTRGRPLATLQNYSFSDRYEMTSAGLKKGNAQPAPVGNSYSDTSSSRGNGVALTPGLYWIEFSLDILSRAPPAIADGQRSEAHLDQGTLTIDVRW